MAQQPVSLEKPIGEEEDSSLGDFIEDQIGRVAVRARVANLRDENICRALAALPGASAR